MSQNTYRARAAQLLDAMRLCSDDLAAYSSAVALLAVHSAIAFNDAVLISLTGKRFAGKDHQAAVTATKKSCQKRNIDCAGLQHLAALVGSKTDVSYGNQSVEQDVANAMAIRAERFGTWASKLIDGTLHTRA